MLVWGGGGDLQGLESFTTNQVAGPANRWKGQNYGAWSNPEYDQLYTSYMQTLTMPDRIQQIADMNRILTRDLPWIPYWYQPLVTAYVGGLKGPIARETPDAPNGMLNIHTWSWE
jgi:ABC-type transport system substrate-binding protein